jgi:hypothetical protein
MSDKHIDAGAEQMQLPRGGDEIQEQPKKRGWGGRREGAGRPKKRDAAKAAAVAAQMFPNLLSWEEFQDAWEEKTGRRPHEVTIRRWAAQGKIRIVRPLGSASLIDITPMLKSFGG